MKLPLAERIGEMIASKGRRDRYFKLSQKNIYIFPTAAGFVFLALLLLMLVTAINYQNSLIYLVTFFLGAIFFFSIWLCFLNISGLEVSSGQEDGVFEGELGYFSVRFKKEEGEVYGLKAGYSADKMSFVSRVNSELSEFPMPAPSLKRGKHTMKRLRLESRFPFGLIKAWTWLKLDAELYIFPKPVAGSANVSEFASETGVNSVQKSDEFNELRSYQAGDSFKRINWKKYASSEVLLVRDADFAVSDASRVRWQDYEPHGKEERLRFMCDRICRLYQAKQAFAMELPVVVLEPDLSEAHFHECLRQLALY